jgi:cyclohexadieny/prephenate dehydrogenase
VTALFERVAFIGIGLIGSSLARRIRQDGLAKHISASARSASTLAAVRALKLADTVTADPAEAARGADLVMICTPMGAYEQVAKAVAPALKRGAIVSDVGSVKRAAINMLAPHLPADVVLIPGHPVAGTEHSGPEAGFPTLFEGHWTILTPPPEADPTSVERVAELWRRCGAKVEIMDADHHDHVLAITSHVPHVIAYSIVGTATHLAEHTQSEVIKFAASGFRDFTRIAASDPTMWRDIFLNNRDAVLEMLGRLLEDVSTLQRAIRFGDGEAMFDFFTRARAIRRGVIEAGQHIPPAPGAASPLPRKAASPRKAAKKPARKAVRPKRHAIRNRP